MLEEQTDPYLLTPGPLTTSLATKQAMLHDWGSRDAGFIATNSRVCSRLLELVNATQTHECVPLQGSGTFAIEATLGTLLDKNSKTLILINGAYGERVAKILKVLDRSFEVLRTAEDVPNDVTQLEHRLQQDTALTHVVAIHCETTSGILNPLKEISDVVVKFDRKLIIDAMSTFGAIPFNAQEIQFDAVVASSNKCLEGAPGVGFSLIRKETLLQSEGNSHSLSLDLFDQWKSMKANSQWRFTPPTHIIMALDAALTQLIDEGGVPARFKRYQNNCITLIKGMRALGFETLVPDDLQAPIIVTFKMPRDPKFSFEAFYEALKNKGYLIYPGKLTVADSFRIGCIGHLGVTQMEGALNAVKATMTELGLETGAP